MDKQALIKKAYEFAEKAYAPYSKFKVGAAVLAESGKIYGGCNIENASYGATICAERVAVSKAISEGEKNILSIAIVSLGSNPTFPCGICRQFLREFNKNLVLIFDSSDGPITYNLSNLMPHSFGPDSLDIV